MELWPPSAEHMAYHEAGHAVLMDAYGWGLQYLAIEPDSTGYNSWTSPIHVSASASYRRMRAAGAAGELPKPTEDELATDLSILVAGEVAAATWASVEDDLWSIVLPWAPNTHEDLARRDPRHLETYQACHAASWFFEGDLDRVRAFVVVQTERARRDIRSRWPAVRAVAEALLQDYRTRRAQERSLKPVDGSISSQRAISLIRQALAESK